MTERRQRCCPSCGYTEQDAKVNGDHRLCKNAGNAPWEKASGAARNVAPPELVVGEKCPTCGWKILRKMGPGNYSCATCGFGMVEPCEHWKNHIYSEEESASCETTATGEVTESALQEMEKLACAADVEHLREWNTNLIAEIRRLR